MQIHGWLPQRSRRESRRCASRRGGVVLPCWPQSPTGSELLGVSCLNHQVIVTDGVSGGGQCLLDESTLKVT